MGSNHRRLTSKWSRRAQRSCVILSPRRAAHLDRLPDGFILEMLAVPYRRLSLNSPVHPLELSQRVAAVTHRRHRWFRLPPTDIQFVGSVTEDRLRLVPVFRGTNTYAPWVRGELRPSGSGSTVDVQMTLHPVAMALVLGFFLFVEVSVSRAEGMVVWWPVAALVVFHIVMYYVGFRPETNRVEALLRELAK